MQSLGQRHSVAMIPQHIVQVRPCLRRGFRCVRERGRARLENGLGRVPQAPPSLPHVVKPVERSIKTLGGAPHPAGFLAKHPFEGRLDVSVGVAQRGVRGEVVQLSHPLFRPRLLSKAHQPRVPVGVLRRGRLDEPSPHRLVVNARFFERRLGLGRHDFRVAHRSELGAPLPHLQTHAARGSWLEMIAKHCQDAAHAAHAGAVLVDAVGFIGQGALLGVEHVGRAFADDGSDDVVERGVVSSHPSILVVAPGKGPVYTDRVAEPKTVPTDASVEEFLQSAATARRRDEGARLADLFREVTGADPVMWGPSIVGFGSFRYVTTSGRTASNLFRAGFSPRKTQLTFYGLTDLPEAESVLARLGTFTRGAGCVYAKKLDDLDLDALRELIALAWSRPDDPEFTR